MTEQEHLDGDLKKFFTSNEEEYLIIGASLLTYGDYSDDEKWHWYSLYNDNLYTTNSNNTEWNVGMTNFGTFELRENSYKLMLSIGKELKAKGYGKRERKEEGA